LPIRRSANIDRRRAPGKLGAGQISLLGWDLRELVRTNDLVLISFIESLLAGANLDYFVADRHMSAVEGSLGFLPRRILVVEEDFFRARRLLGEAGLAAELRDE
jgi:hypothetical protein